MTQIKVDCTGIKYWLVSKQNRWMNYSKTIVYLAQRTYDHFIKRIREVGVYSKGTVADGSVECFMFNFSKF
jgi:hypothetical protein